jgi:radical SAM superfamily enzyme YgiQ (UPF0313 family)
LSTSSYLHKNLAIEFGNLSQGRAVEAVALWAGEAGVEADFDMTVCSGLHLQPTRLGTVLAKELGIAQSRVVVAGPYDDRLLLIEVGSGTWVAASLSSPSLRESALPVLVREGLALEDADKAVTLAHPGDDVIERLTRPRVVLISLFKPSVFPLPRFALGVSDIARAVRHSFAGRVEVIDMQFGLGVEDVARKVHDLEPDLVGISATFGQHDLMRELLDLLFAQGGVSPSSTVLGGSLAALNANLLCEKYPGILVAEGPGEKTMTSVVRHWRGEIEREEIEGVLGGGREPSKLRPTHRDADSFMPELDLLERTLDEGGVMQLESSRGCTHACSFCPRSHKGLWAGEGSSLETILAAIEPVYEKRPTLSRKIFLVDEEFVGYDREGEALERCETVATQLHDAGFTWETSTRVDQVARPDRNRDWHLRRIEFWRALLDQGLGRCLFGVESGVDTILRRFNKHTTAEQNVLAIRTLTAMGAPIRITYITFDPLMTREELVESYRFQGRRDVILPPDPSLSPAELYEAVRDPDYVAGAVPGKPFYDEISYMLVSMECLIGSPYLQAVEEAGLAREVQPLMGRRNAAYADPSIGLMSEWSQRWIDRSFSFDYTLKSLEKIFGREQGHAIRSLRGFLKQSSYEFLGGMIGIGQSLDPAACRALAERRMELLREEVRVRLSLLLEDLDPVLAGRLAAEHESWRNRVDWGLINDA